MRTIRNSGQNFDFNFFSSGFYSQPACKTRTLYEKPDLTEKVLSIIGEIIYILMLSKELLQIIECNFMNSVTGGKTSIK